MRIQLCIPLIQQILRSEFIFFIWHKIYTWETFVSNIYPFSEWGFGKRLRLKFNLNYLLRATSHKSVYSTHRSVPFDIHVKKVVKKKTIRHFRAPEILSLEHCPNLSFDKNFKTVKKETIRHSGINNFIFTYSILYMNLPFHL